MDTGDIDCASCGYAIKDFVNVVTVSCGHGVIHRNCSYFNTECSVCDEKLVAKDDIYERSIQFRPRDTHNEETTKIQLIEISSSLQDLKSLLVEQRQEQIKTTQVVDELTKQLKTKDDKILELQKEIYELKLEKIEGMKKDLQEKLNNIVW